MPPKKKKGYSSGKKKKGAAASRTHQRVASSSTANRDNSSSHSSHRDPFRALGKENLPTFHDANRGGGSGGSSGGGYYETYKRATTRFCDWMKGVSAQLGMEKMKSVNDLRKGADTVLSRNLTLLTAPPPPDPIVAPLEIIKALETGIKYREIFTRTTFGSEEGGDKGHWYMAQVLKYCQAALVQSRKVARIVVEARASAISANDDGSNDGPEDKDKIDRVGGRFHALLSIFEDEPEDEEDDEEEKEHIRRGDLPALEVELPPAPTEEIDIQRDLIEGDDTFQAWALFHTMDQLMWLVDSHYSMLKNYLRGQEHFSYESPVQLLLECTATTNLAIQSVRTAEAALIARHPHLSSFYHVLALVFLPMMVADVDKLLSQKRRDQEDHLTLDFVASIVECAFHNRGHDRVTGKVKRHTNKMGVSFSVLEIKAQQIFTIMSFEALLLIENGETNASERLIQMIMDVLNDNQKLVCKAGFWGHDFSENHRPAKLIRAGLDEVLGGHLMPELLEICRQAPFHLLPEMSKLMPVLDMLHNHMDLRQGDRTRPISIALTFGLHSVLTSIFIMQGSGDLARVASLGKRSFETLFGQLDSICDPSRQPENSPGFYLNVALFKNVANFAKPVWSHVDTHLTMLDPEQTERLAFWNPVIGGGYLLYGTYICSIGLGSATVDSLGQLRFTLHLYNALKKCNSIPVLKIPFLELLEATFSKTKAIWVGGHPDKGSFCKHFWLAWGTSIAYANQLAAECAVGNDELGAQLGEAKYSEFGNHTLDEINPSEFSASYKCVVELDFNDDKDDAAKYTSVEASLDFKKDFAHLIDHMTHVNITRDSMDEDESFVMNANFPAIGCMLLEYLNALSAHMGWDVVIDKSISQFPEMLRTGKTMGGKKMKPGGFNASDFNLKFQGLAHICGTFLAQLDASTIISSTSMNPDRVAKFTQEFFEDRDTTEYTFFAPDVGLSAGEGRCPLDGSYPIGRTGLSAQEPLQAFMHFKYSKRG